MAHSFYHHWQFLAPDGSEGSVDPVPLSLFEQYIDHLKDRGDLQFTTLDNQNVLPRSAKTQLNLTASSTVSASTNRSPPPQRSPGSILPLTSGSRSKAQVDKALEHMVNGVRFNDTTIETDSSRQVTHTASWATPGYLTYYASFPGDSSYGASYSSPLTMYVSERTQVALAAWGVIPTIN